MKDNNNEYLSDVYISYNNDGEWTKPEPMDNVVNTDADEICSALSPDGQRIFISKEEEGNMELYVSELKGDSWSQLKKLAEHNINTSFNETHASFSYDDIKIYLFPIILIPIKGQEISFLAGR